MQKDKGLGFVTVKC